ncbi:hypothetical protein ACJX0J_031859, partial [Zea mays]
PLVPLKVHSNTKSITKPVWAQKQPFINDIIHTLPKQKNSPNMVSRALETLDVSKISLFFFLAHFLRIMILATLALNFLLSLRNAASKEITRKPASYLDIPKDSLHHIL